jgi:hypothetical protein
VYLWKHITPPIVDRFSIGCRFQNRYHPRARRSHPQAPHESDSTEISDAVVLIPFHESLTSRDVPIAELAASGGLQSELNSCELLTRVSQIPHPPEKLTHRLNDRTFYADRHRAFLEDTEKHHPGNLEISDSRINGLGGSKKIGLALNISENRD